MSAADLHREQELAGRRLDRSTIARLAGLLREQRRLVAWVMIMQGLAVSTIVARPWFIGGLIDHGLMPLIDGGVAFNHHYTLLLALALAALWSLRFVLLIIARLAAVDLVVRLLADLRVRLYAHVQSLSVRYFDLTRAGRVVSRVDRDVDSLQPLFLEGMPQLLGVLLRCIGGAVMLLLVLPSVLGGLLILAPLLLLSMWLFRRIGTRIWGRVNEHQSRVTAHLVETINGVRLVQQTVFEQRNQAHYDQLLSDLDRVAVRAAWGWGWFMPYIFMLFTVGIAVVVIQGGSALALGEITPGRLTESIFYVFLFLGPLMELGDLFERACSGAAAAQRIFLLLDTTPDIQDDDQPQHFPARPHGQLSMHNVSFRYLDHGPLVLNHIDLEIASGSTVAIVGSTGHGKSTLVQLLTRFYDPDQGSIQLDGIDLRQLPQHELRRHVALVLQDNVLFTGTVLANLRLANEDLSDEQIIAAARDLGINEVIEHLPQRWYSEVGARGDQLSHGQRQVVCLLRAWIADPAVLILDEATSAVDIRTEGLIQSALRRLMHGRTAIVVAHRLATVRDADRILVMEHGRIIEDGSHQDLLAQGGAYAKLHGHLAG